MESNFNPKRNIVKNILFSQNRDFNSQKHKNKQLNMKNATKKAFYQTEGFFVGLIVEFSHFDEHKCFDRG